MLGRIPFSSAFAQLLQHRPVQQAAKRWTATSWSRPPPFGFGLAPSSASPPSPAAVYPLVEADLARRGPSARAGSPLSPSRWRWSPPRRSRGAAPATWSPATHRRLRGPRIPRSGGRLRGARPRPSRLPAGSGWSCFQRLRRGLRRPNLGPLDARRCRALCDLMRRVVTSGHRRRRRPPRPGRRAKAGAAEFAWRPSHPRLVHRLPRRLRRCRGRRGRRRRQAASPPRSPPGS